MKRPRALSPAFVIVALAVAIGCSDRPPIGPDASVPAPQQDLIGSLLGSTGLLSCSPLPYDSVTQTVGKSGGVIEIGPHRLLIPANALSGPVNITAVAPVGNVNFVRFKPEGLQFERSAALTMSYANCNLLGKLLPKRIAYTTDKLVILEYLLSLDLLNLKTVTGQLNHFSGYAVAW